MHESQLRPFDLELSIRWAPLEASKLGRLSQFEAIITPGSDIDTLLHCETDLNQPAPLA
jgi:hypothetical protein